jgi:hypothetical protein
MSDQGQSAEGQNGDATAAPASVGGQITAFTEAIEKVRGRVDLTAKTLGTLGTTGVSAIGIAKIADVFPYEGPWQALAGLIAGFVAMFSAVIVFSARLWRTQEPIVMRSDPKEIDTLRSLWLPWVPFRCWREARTRHEEKALVDHVYADFTSLNNVSSLIAYEAREHRFRRIARWLEGDEATRLTDRADEISADVLETQARAALILIRNRAKKALFGLVPILMYVVFFVGLGGFAISSNALESNRTGQLDLAQKCAAAKSAGVGTLPDSCDDYNVTSKPAPSARDTAASGLAALSAARADCIAAAEKEGQTTPDPCVGLDRAIRAGK